MVNNGDALDSVPYESVQPSFTPDGHLPSAPPGAPNTSAAALYKWLRELRFNVNTAHALVGAVQATLPVGEDTVPRSDRVDCDASERCSFRALHRCASCHQAICNNHGKRGSDMRGEPPNRRCSMCKELFPLAARTGT